MKQKPLKERLIDRLQKLGLSKRMAESMGPRLVVAASKVPVKGTITGKLTARLLALGLSEKKAATLAKGLAPMVRANVKRKVAEKKITLDDVDDDMVEETVEEGIDASDDQELDSAAPRVNGHRVRLDLPTAPMEGIKGIELLRVMHGLTTLRTYLVAAVKKDKGIVAVRQFDQYLYNVKFYPDMAYWNQVPEGLARIGAHDHLKREWYERMHFSREALDTLLKELAKTAKPKSKIKALMKRFLSVGSGPLVKAFDYLHKRVGKAA